MMVKLANGKRYRPKDTDEVRCHEHGVVTTWGALSPIQKLCLEEGLDTKERCLLAPEDSTSAEALENSHGRLGD
jgi:hypothetical protein